MGGAQCASVAMVRSLPDKVRFWSAVQLYRIGVPIKGNLPLETDGFKEIPDDSGISQLPWLGSSTSALASLCNTEMTQAIGTLFPLMGPLAHPPTHGLLRT